MRSTPIAALMLAAVLSLPTLVHAQSAPVEEDDLAQAAQETWLALKRSVLAAQQAQDGSHHASSPVEEAQRRVFARSLVPPEHAIAAWHRALDSAGDGSAREQVLLAEAELLRVAASSAREAYAIGDADAARAWLQVVLGRVDAEARQLDVLAPSALQDAESLEEALRAALAARAREEAVQAVLLVHEGLEADAQASAAGAAALAELVAPDARRLLAPGMLAVFEENRTDLAEALANLPDQRKNHALSGFLAPLVALEFNRDIEPLDEFGSRNLDAVLVAARAAREDVALAEALSRQALEQYTADRAGLFLRGEGSLEAADRSYRAFENATVQAETGLDPEDVQEAARQAAQSLRQIALLERGIVLKVEVGGLQPGRLHEYGVTLVRPPLEGVRAYRIEIRYDPEVARIRDAVPLLWQEGFRHEAGAGRIVLHATSPEPLAHSAHLAKLRIEAVGPPEHQTNLTIAHAEFHELDGDLAQTFRLRHGGVTVAVVPAGDPVDEPAVAALEQEERAAPALAAWSLLLAVATVARLHRRGRRG